MRRRGILVLALLASFAGGAHAQEQTYTFQPSASLAPLIDTDFRDAAAGYGRSLEPLATALQACPGDPAPARQAFAGVVAAWGRLQPLVGGQLGDQVLASRIAFWPDRHGTAGRQLGTALSTRDPTVTDPRTLAGKSAALLSLHALERVLFAPGDADPAFACSYARAIVGVQQGLARDAAGVFARATRDPAVLLQGVFATLRDGLDAVLRLKLEVPLGKDPGEARGERAEFWRSGTSLQVIDANLALFQDLMKEPRGLAVPLDYGPEGAGTAGVIEGRLEDARAALARIPAPLHVAVMDPAGWAAVDALAGEIRALRTRVVDRLGPALGVSGGFNALDGD